MEVKTGALRDQLSRYLKRVRQTGDPIIVLDRNVPVAEIRPYTVQTTESASDVWKRRTLHDKNNGPLDEDFDLPPRHTAPSKLRHSLD